MDLKARFNSIPPGVAVNPASGTPLSKMDLTAETEQALRDAEFQTAGEVASCSAEDLMALLVFTPRIISEIQDALARFGLGMRRVWGAVFMQMKQMRVGPFPLEIEEDPFSATRLEELRCRSAQSTNSGKQGLRRRGIRVFWALQLQSYITGKK